LPDALLLEEALATRLRAELAVEVLVDQTKA
jgi:hypothetical protein